MEHHLSIEESIRFGWVKTREHSTLIFKALLTLFGVQIAEQIVARVLVGTLEGAVAAVILLVLTVVLAIGFTNIVLKLAEGKHATYQDLVPPLAVWLSYLGAALLAVLISVLPLLAALLVCLVAIATLPQMLAMGVCVFVAAAALVASVYLGLRYAFVRFAILDDTDIIKSLRTSAHLSKGIKWWLIAFTIVIVLLNLLGALLFLVGLLVSMPVTLFAFAHVYVKMRSHHA